MHAISSTSAQHTFHHEKLHLGKDSVRLLKLLPNDLSETPNCQLIHSTLAESKQKYVALSYNWGKPARVKRHICINGQLHSVRENLWQFFRACQRLHIFETFWIDAVCIDQHNVAERNHQVTQMGTIYSLARMTYVWIGEPCPSSIEATIEILETAFWSIWSSFGGDSPRTDSARASHFTQAEKLPSSGKSFHHDSLTRVGPIALLPTKVDMFLCSFAKWTKRAGQRENIEELLRWLGRADYWVSLACMP